MQNVLLDPLTRMNCPHCGEAIDIVGIEPFKQMTCAHCGHHANVPGKFGNYTLHHHIGESVTSSLYSAADPLLGRNVTLKILNHVLSKNQDLVEAFKREALAAAALNSANVLRVYEFGVHNRQPFMVMEHMQGDFLHVIAQRGNLSEPRVIEIAEGIIQGLADTHQCGIVHGDITPRNILIDQFGTPKLCDFGLAHFQHEKSDLIDTWSSPYYMPPERILGHSEDHRSDFYSLGTTLYYLLTDQLPFFDLNEEVVLKRKTTEPPPDPRLFRPDLTDEFAELVMMMLHRDINRRPANYPELFDLLDQVKTAVSLAEKLRTRKPESTTGPLQVQDDAPPLPGKGRFLVPGILLITALILILVLTRRQSQPPSPPPSPAPSPTPAEQRAEPTPAPRPTATPRPLPTPTPTPPPTPTPARPEVSIPVWNRSVFFQLPEDTMAGPLPRWEDREAFFTAAYPENPPHKVPGAINNLPAVRFHDSPIFSMLHPARDPEFTVVLVAKFQPAENRSPQVLAGIDPQAPGENWFLIRHMPRLPGSLVFESPSGAARLSLSRAERERPFVAAFRRDARGDHARAGPHRLQLSGTPFDPPPLDGPVFQSLQIGGLMERGFSFDGYIAELHVFRQALTDQQLNLLFRQLEEKYQVVPE
jgi:serine/threonine protein kinase